MEKDRWAENSNAPCTKTALSNVSTLSGSPAGRTVHQWLFLVRTKPAHPGPMSFKDHGKEHLGRVVRNGTQPPPVIIIKALVYVTSGAL